MLWHLLTTKLIPCRGGIRFLFNIDIVYAPLEEEGEEEGRAGEEVSRGGKRPK